MLPAPAGGAAGRGGRVCSAAAQGRHRGHHPGAGQFQAKLRVVYMLASAGGSVQCSHNAVLLCACAHLSMCTATRHQLSGSMVLYASWGNVSMHSANRTLGTRASDRDCLQVAADMQLVLSPAAAALHIWLDLEAAAALQLDITAAAVAEALVTVRTPLCACMVLRPTAVTL